MVCKRANDTIPAAMVAMRPPVKVYVASPYLGSHSEVSKSFNGSYFPYVFLHQNVQTAVVA